MTGIQFDMLEAFYMKCRTIRDGIYNAPTPMEIGKFQKEFARIDFFELLQTAQETTVDPGANKIREVRDLILQATNGTVNLSDYLVKRIIEKSML